MIFSKKGIKYANGGDNFAADWVKHEIKMRELKSRKCKKCDTIGAHWYEIKGVGYYSCPFCGHNEVFEIMGV